MICCVLPSRQAKLRITVSNYMLMVSLSELFHGSNTGNECRQPVSRDFPTIWTNNKDSDQPGHHPVDQSIRWATLEVADGLSFLHAESDVSDETGWMPKLNSLGWTQLFVAAGLMSLGMDAALPKHLLRLLAVFI